MERRNRNVIESEAALVGDNVPELLHLLLETMLDIREIVDKRKIDVDTLGIEMEIESLKEVLMEQKK